MTGRQPPHAPEHPPRADATILVPELNRLARLFETQRRSSAAPSEPAAPAEPAAAPGPA